MTSGDAVRRLIGRRLREERKRAGYGRVGDFASVLGISRSRLSRIESGAGGVDSGLLRRVAALLEVPMESFFDARPADGTLVRCDDADEKGTREMLDWALELRRDLDLVAAFECGEQRGERRVANL